VVKMVGVTGMAAGRVLSGPEWKMVLLQFPSVYSGEYICTSV